MTLRDEVAQLIFISFHGAAPNSRSREYRKFMRADSRDQSGRAGPGELVQRARDPEGGAVRGGGVSQPHAAPGQDAADGGRRFRARRFHARRRHHGLPARHGVRRHGRSRATRATKARSRRAKRARWACTGSSIRWPTSTTIPDNPIINIRSFGENPEAVAAQVKAFIEGAHSDKKNYVLTTVKHFPGHGDTAVDTHMNLPAIPADRERLDRVELVPFKAAIEAGVDSVMTAHIAVPALAPPDVPSTLSPAILTGLLQEGTRLQRHRRDRRAGNGGHRQGLHHRRSRGARARGRRRRAADADRSRAVVKAVVAAVQSGRLTRQRIQESVIKVLAAKEKVGLDRKRFVDLEAISDIVDSPEANEKAQEIADRAVTLVRNGNSMIPLAAPDKACYVVMPESRFSSEGQAFTQEIRKIAPRAPVEHLGSYLLTPAIG